MTPPRSGGDELKSPKKKSHETAKKKVYAHFVGGPQHNSLRSEDRLYGASICVGANLQIDSFV